jgi:hypothetical protein
MKVLSLLCCALFVAPVSYAQEAPQIKLPAQNPVTPATPIVGWNLDLNHASQPLYERGTPAFVVGRAPNVGAAVPRLELWNHRNEKLADLVALAPDADGRVTWQLPSDRNGYFEVRPAETASGWPALGSRPANKLPFAVVDKINPNPSRDYTDHFLSIQGSSPAGTRNGKPFRWDVYRYMGLQAQALDYSWSKLEPKPSTPKNDTYAAFFAQDGAVESIRELKTWPYFYLSKLPAWAVDISRLPEAQQKKTVVSTLPPRDFKQYEAYLERVVPYIAKTYDFLPYRVYEVQWEPVIPWGWHGTKEEIVKMFEVAHRVVRKHDPNGRISGPTLSSFNDLPLYEDLLRLGLGRYIDVSGWHMYASYPPEKARIPEALRRIRSLNQQYTGRDLPIIGTEFGLPEGVTGSVENQAYGMTAALLTFRAEGIKQHALFYLTDYASEPGYGLFYTAIAGLPYAPDKIAPKPAIPMLRAAIDQVGAARGLGRLDYLGPDVWGYAFRDETSGELLAALWNARDDDRKVTLDTGAARVRVVDAFGNSEDRVTRNEKIELQLRRSPVYVRGLSAELFTPSSTTLLQTEPVWRVFRGQKTTYPLQLSRALPTKTATLAVEMPPSIAAPIASRSIKGTAGAKVQIPLQIAPDAPLGVQAASLRVRGEGQTLHRALQRVEVVPELQIAPAQLQNEGTKWALESRVKNVSPAGWNGQAVLRLGGETQKRPLQLAPGQEVVLRFPVAAPSDATRKVPANLEMRASNGSLLDLVTPLSFFSIQKANANDLWNSMRLLPLKATNETIYRTFAQNKFEGDADLSARAGYAYDANNLYVQFRVEDEVHRSDAISSAIWKQDSLQLAFDVAPDRETNANGIAEAFERTASEWGFAFTSRGPEVYLWKPPGGSALEANSSVLGAGIRLEGGREGTTTTYRITMPWKVIDPRALRSQTPEKAALGISAAINDSDVESAHLDRRALLLFGGIVHHKDPVNYGRALLD